jgi:hypothetical protein
LLLRQFMYQKNPAIVAISANPPAIIPRTKADGTSIRAATAAMTMSEGVHHPPGIRVARIMVGYGTAKS